MRTAVRVPRSEGPGCVEVKRQRGSGPGPGRPRTTLRVVRRRGGSGRATAARTGRAGGGPILLGVDHEHPTRPDHQMIDVGPATRDGQIFQDGLPVPLQRTQGGRCAAPPPLPAAKRQPLGRNRNPQPAATAASTPRTRLRRGASRLASTPPTSTDPEDEGDPPGQAPGPGGPLGRPQPPPTSQDARHLSAVTSPACRDGS